MSNEGSEKASEIKNELTLEGYVDERTVICNPVFRDGFSVGWHFVIPEAFKEALDIKSTPRVFGGKRFEVMTQGKNYSFKKGDVLYDSLQAYKLPWGEALKHIGYSLQIEEAIPASIETTKEYETQEAVEYLEDKKKRAEPKVLSFKRTRTSFGRVRFTLFKPDLGEGKVKPHRILESDQERFILFLQTGILRTKDNEVFTLDKTPPTAM